MNLPGRHIAVRLPEYYTTAEHCDIITKISQTIILLHGETLK